MAVDKLWRTVGDVVERARAGDQVAMALIIETRREAAMGNKKARRSALMFMKYIKQNPPSRFGVCDITQSESMLRLWSLHAVPTEAALNAVLSDCMQVKPWQAIVAISHTPPQLFEDIGAAVKTVPDEQRRAMFEQLVTLSARIRRLEDPSIPISAFCPVVGWELGE